MNNTTHTLLRPRVIILGIIALLIIWVGASYNTLVTKREAATTAWAQIDTQLQRRYDLIPNLVSSVKGVAAQEQKVFGDLADARARYSGASGNSEAQTVAANEIESALSRLLVIVEAYPTLQSSAAFTGLMAELAGSENRVAVARKDYNDVVRVYETTRKRFPGSVIARMFTFEPLQYFTSANEGVKNTPVVNFE